MTSPYKEWEIMTHILGRIPQRFQRGLFTTDIQITSGDVHNNIIVLGSNVPSVYMFDKISGNLLETLKCGKSIDRVTTLVIQESLEVIVAAGTEKGLVYVFQLPSSLPGRCKELKQFVLPRLLKNEVSSIALSTNCSKLFAGDSSGNVTSAVIDYEKGECAAEVVVKESAAIVQLAYSRGLLLVATRCQAILYDCDLRTSVKIGSQDRAPGNFGGQFARGDCKKSDATVYVSRPGYRLWRCDSSGQVKATLVFKELVDKAPEIQLVVAPSGRLTEHIMSRGAGSTALAEQFEQMLALSDKCIVIWNDDALYVIDIVSNTIVGVCRDIGPVLHVFAKNPDEIYLLRRGVQRRLIRIALTQLTSPASAPGAAASGGTDRTSAGAAAGQRPLLDSPLLFEHQEPAITTRKLKGVETKIHSGLDNMKKGFSSLMKGALRGQSSGTGSGNADRPSSHKPLSVAADSDKAQADLSHTSERDEETALVIRMPVLDARKPSSATQLASSVTLTTSPSLAMGCCDDAATETLSRDISHADPVPKTCIDGPLPLERSASFGEARSLVSSIESAKADESAPQQQQPPETEKEARKAKKSKQKKAANKVEVAASMRFKALYDQLSRNLVDDVPTIAYDRDEGDAAGSSLAVDAPPASSSSVSSSPSAGRLDLLDKRVDGEHAPTSSAFHETTGDGEPPAPLAADAQPEAKPMSPVDEPAIYDLYRSGDFEGSAFANSEADPDGPATDFCAAVKDAAIDSTLGNLNQTDTPHKANPKRNLWPIISEEWTEYNATKTVKCTAVSSAYIAYVDKDNSIYYCRLKDQNAFEWKKIDLTGSAIRLSPAGDIGWRLSADGTAFAGGCRAQVVSPSLLKWTEAVRTGVTSVAVGENVAWYIKEGGRLHVHEGVSKERPVTRSLAVHCESILTKVSGRRRNLLWGLTSENDVLRYDGTSWHRVPLPPGSHAICDLSVEREDSAWVVDMAGNVWFAELSGFETVDVDHRAQTDALWWQVNYHLNLAPSHRRQDSGQRAAAAHKQSRCLISAGDSAIVLSVEPRKSLQIRLGHVVGHRWALMSFAGIALSTRWDIAFMADPTYLWLVQSKHDLFCYNIVTKRMRAVALPECPSTIRSVSGGTDVLWVLFDDGRVFVSTGVHISDPSGISTGTQLGTSWAELDLSQLSEVRLKHLSVGVEYVWAVDEYGGVYVRVGAMPKQNRHMNPAWAALETKSPQMGSHFTSIHVSQDGKIVWALDNRNNVFARRGITTEMPLGVSWVHVIGAPVKQLALMDDAVWALTPDGEVMCRAGVTPTNVTGEFWKILPGQPLRYICTSLNNDLWAINAEGQVLEHLYKAIGRVAPRKQRTDSELDQDWELL